MKVICGYACTAAMLLIGGCAHVAVEGGDKPIKIDMTVTLKVDQQLDQFYSFEKKYDQAASTQPATTPMNAPTTTPGGAP